MTNIKVYWIEGDEVTLWIGKFAKIMEVFGLPGDKYLTNAHDEYMLFSFVDAEDAVMAKLMLGD